MRFLTYIGYMIMGIVSVVVGNVVYSVLSAKFMEHVANKELSEHVDMD
jgi:hypothetical protein